MAKKITGLLLTLIMLFSAHPCASKADGYTLTLSKHGTVNMDPGDSVTVSVSVTPVNLMEHTVYWTSKNEYVASVSSKGKITAKAAGRTTITATIETGDSASLTVVVSGNAVKSLVIPDSDIELEIGATAQLTCTMNEDADDKRVKWFSDDETVAIVSSSGLVKAIGGGTAVITVMAVNGTTASASVYVPSEVQSVLLDPAELVVGPGHTGTLDAYVFPGNARYRALKWESSDESVATVDENGVVTGVSVGVCTVKATAPNGVCASSEITVSKIPASITLSDSRIVLSREKHAWLLRPIIEPLSAADCDIRWESDDESVAVVHNGYVAATGLGYATITASVPGGLTAACDVYVGNPPTSVAFSQENYSLSVKSEPFQLTLLFEPSGTYANVLSWKAENTKIAFVDSNGLVTPRKAGTTVVTAECEGGLTARTEITVCEEARFIAIANGSPSMIALSSMELYAVSQTGARVTTPLIWTSDAPEICAVSPTGTLYAREAGSAAITVRNEDGSLSAHCSVTVYPNENAQRRHIALTFDNGPDEHTADILDALSRYGVRATFFLLGANVEKMPKIASLLADTPHEIGNHTYRNASLNTLKLADITTSIEKTDSLIQLTTGRTPTVLRAPDASLSTRLFTSFLDTRRFIGWSADTGDSQKSATAAEIVENALINSFDTAILVFHDAGNETAEALETLIPELILRGYDFVTVSELIDITGDTNGLFTTKKPSGD